MGRVSLKPGETLVTDTTVTPDTKPALASTTLQGAIIAILSALAPTIANFLHLQASDIVQVVAAAGTVIGFIMTVIGRFKATKALT